MVQRTCVTRIVTPYGQLCCTSRVEEDTKPESLKGRIKQLEDELAEDREHTRHKIDEIETELKRLRKILEEHDDTMKNP